MGFRCFDSVQYVARKNQFAYQQECVSELSIWRSSVILLKYMNSFVYV